MTIVNLAELINAKAIIVSDRYCGLAHAIAMFRPQCIILAVTDNRMVARQCHLYRGIIPLIMDEGTIFSITHNSYYLLVALTHCTILTSALY